MTSSDPKHKKTTSSIVTSNDKSEIIQNIHTKSNHALCFIFHPTSQSSSVALVSKFSMISSSHAEPMGTGLQSMAGQKTQVISSRSDLNITTHLHETMFHMIYFLKLCTPNGVSEDVSLRPAGCVIKAVGPSFLAPRWDQQKEPRHVQKMSVLPSGGSYDVIHMMSCV